MKKSDYTIISLGGSVIIPPGGFDLPFLMALRDLILKKVKSGNRFIFVAGGGATARFYQGAGKSLGYLTNEDLDWIGIKTTALNAEFLKFLLKEVAHGEVVLNPTKKVKTGKPVIVAAGWKPGCSTDNDAVLLAKTYGAKQLLNVSNIDYVYTSDPKQNSDAKKLPNLSWKELKQIVGDSWTPGANVPFDPTAAKLAERLKLRVGFVKGTDLKSLDLALSGKPFPGSIIG